MFRMYTNHSLALVFPLVHSVKRSARPMFSSKSLIVSGLTFRSLIHFEIIFVYSVRECSNFVLLHVPPVAFRTSRVQNCGEKLLLYLGRLCVELSLFTLSEKLATTKDGEIQGNLKEMFYIFQLHEFSVTGKMR